MEDENVVLSEEMTEELSNGKEENEIDLIWINRCSS